MAEEYTGWKLFDKIIIVAKPRFNYNYETRETETLGDCQGYLVDPKNKKQLETAISWATTYDYHYEIDEKGNKKCIDKTAIMPEQFTYDNDGFELELYNSADGSSQGGKLSFWNCWITAPDGKRFLIGIAADLLLDILRSSTVINGKVQDKLMFARCQGGVGMLSKSMDSYKNAIKDMTIKKDMSRGRTSKHKVGYVYQTATEQNVYLGKFYRWYEPIYQNSYDSYGRKKIIGFKKLDKPIEKVFFPNYWGNKTKVSDYDIYLWQSRDKAPARKETNIVLEVDITMDEIVKKCEEYHFWQGYNTWLEERGRGYNYSRSINPDAIGLSASNTEYTMPQKLRSALYDWGYKVED